MPALPCLLFLLAPCSDDAMDISYSAHVHDVIQPIVLIHFATPFAETEFKISALISAMQIGITTQVFARPPSIPLCA